jgi:hypothetical protein
MKEYWWAKYNNAEEWFSLRCTIASNKKDQEFLILSLDVYL